MTTIDLKSGDPSRIKADAVVIGITKRGNGIGFCEGASPIEVAYGKNLKKTLTAMGATGKAGQVIKIPAAGRISATLVVAVGVGDKPDDIEGLRRATGSAIRALAGSSHAVLALPTTTGTAVGAVADGALLGAYAFLGYRKSTAADHKSPVSKVTVISPAARRKDATSALNAAKAIARGVHLARDLVNTPPSDLHPKDFAEAAVSACRSLKLDVDVLDQRALSRGKFGGILAVGQGSAHPPRLVRISYQHPKAKRHLALVGKGITFDSGGISLKPPAQMDHMKSDMGGAAAVLGAMTAIARLRPQINVTGWMPLAENMPSGSAQRPSDVITIRGGKTVEVLNTDAEGRLVLADALVRAGEEEPDVIVDAATLTGAALVALGATTAGIMSNDEALRSTVHEVAARVGELMWPMPLPPELRPSMDSAVADIANIGDRYGGMLVAGLFLQEFVPDGTCWAHLDIAGPAFNTAEPSGYTPKGGTGSAVRTFVGLTLDLARS